MQALCGLQGIFDLFNCKTPGLYIPQKRQRKKSLTDRNR